MSGLAIILHPFWLVNDKSKEKCKGQWVADKHSPPPTFQQTSPWWSTLANSDKALSALSPLPAILPGFLSEASLEQNICDVDKWLK